MIHLIDDVGKSTCFNSLQTGKRISSADSMEAAIIEYVGFNSLQTGKRISSLASYSQFVVVIVSIPFKRESVSQVVIRSCAKSACHVSIPFKRESVSQVRLPQRTRIASICFNSLQTGKRISRYFNCETEAEAYDVSIPFKRESVSQVQRAWDLARDIEKFQFPSNGKAYLKSESTPIRWSVDSFNSLQTGKCISRPLKKTDTVKITVEFQFPSNGKVYLKSKIQWKRLRVLSLFQFPSNGKVYLKRKSRAALSGSGHCFNSLQTGKCISSDSPSPNCKLKKEFQFPSNGKVYLKGRIRRTLQPVVNLFQFPSNGKVYLKQHATQSGILPVSFNSLQTGKCISREAELVMKAAIRKFQFPSNGKVYLKSKIDSLTSCLEIVSIPFKRESVSQVTKSTVSYTCTCVSIPFKRESVSQAIKLKALEVQSELFQFPSNGKVYLKSCRLVNSLLTNAVKLFQFPSNGKVYLKNGVYRGIRNLRRFNSLQTGKCISRLRSL